MRVVLLTLFLLTSLHGAVTDDRLHGIFSPLKIEIAALSPDGRRVAFSSREGDQVFVHATEVDAAEHISVRALAITDERAEGYMEPEDRRRPGAVQWMSWVSNQRIALATNVQFLVMQGRAQGALYAFDSDGKNLRTVLSARQGIGFVRAVHLNPQNPREVLSTFDGDVVLADTSTGRRRILKQGDSRAVGEAYRAGLAARRTEFDHVRHRVGEMLPGYLVKVIEDPRPGARHLALAECIADPGGFLIVDPAANRVWDFLRRAPDHDAHRALRTEPFSLSPPDGGQPVTGLLVHPVLPRVQRAPLVLWLNARADTPAARDYRPEIQALAEFGFAVAVIDGTKGADGHATPRLESERLVRAVDLLAQHFPVSRRSVALIGKAGAGRRALELAARAAGRFRCVVSLSLQPDTNFSGVGELQNLLRATAEPPTAAALVCAWRGPPKPVNAPAANGTPPYPPFEAARNAVQALRAKGVAATLRPEDHAYQAGEATALAATFREIEAFLNEHLYRYSAQLGEIEVLGSDVPLPQR